MEALSAYKFARDVLPLMLSDAAAGHRPALQPQEPAPPPPPEQANPAQPQESPYSDPNQAANIPQGPTAVNSPAVPAPVPVEPHTLDPAAQQKAALNMHSVQSFGHSAIDALNRAALNYSERGVGGVVAEPAAALAIGTKKVLQDLIRKYRSAPTGSMTQRIPNLFKRAGWGGAAMNFGRGAVALTKPITGVVRGGLRGGAAGTAAAARTIASSPAAAAGAATAAYTGYKMMRNPVVEYGDGFKLQSPVRIPNMRFQMPVTWAGNGVRFQPPVKTLW